MKRILSLILSLSLAITYTGCKAQAIFPLGNSTQIIDGRGALKGDSGLIFTVRDTSNFPFKVPGIATLRPQDSSLYVRTNFGNWVKASSGGGAVTYFSPQSHGIILIGSGQLANGPLNIRIDSSLFKSDSSSGGITLSGSGQSYGGQRVISIQPAALDTSRFTQSPYNNYKAYITGFTLDTGHVINFTRTVNALALYIADTTTIDTSRLRQGFIKSTRSAFSAGSGITISPVGVIASTGIQSITYSGDVTGSGTTNVALTLNSVNGAPGTAGSGTTVPVITTNAKGLVTNVTTASITYPITSVNGITGAAVLNTDNIAQGTSNKYFTNALAQAAFTYSRPIINTSGTLSLDTATWNVGLSNKGYSRWVADSAAAAIAISPVTIGTINGNTKGANGITNSGSTLFAQTVDYSHPGLMSSQQNINYDSLFLGTKVDTIHILIRGTGLTPISVVNNNTIGTNTSTVGFGIQQSQNTDSTIVYSLAPAFASSRDTVFQTAHGFSVLTPIYFNGTLWAKADTLHPPVGVVSDSISVNQFEYTTNGKVYKAAHGLTLGSTYFVNMPAGSYSSISPNESFPIFTPVNANYVEVNIERPYNFNSSAFRSGHTVFTPTTGGTVTLVDNQYNIINPSGTLSTLTVTLPSSPTDNDEVLLKFTQAVSTLTVSGGTVGYTVPNPSIGSYFILRYDASTSKWY